MEIKLINITDSYYKVEKDVTGILGTFDVFLRTDRTNTDTPIFDLRTGQIPDANYLQADFDGVTRYYYITRVEVITNDVIRLYCKTDLLQTYKDYIKHMTGVFVYGDRANGFTSNRDTTHDTRPVITKHTFPNTGLFNEKDSSIIMVTLKGKV